MADHLRTELVVGALEMAVWNRQLGEGVIHHLASGLMPDQDQHCVEHRSYMVGYHCALW